MYFRQLVLVGRYDKSRWKQWNKNLYRISSISTNTIAANNHYDREYMKYFTNLTNIELLPNYCSYIQNSYLPTRREVLIVPSRGINDVVLSRLLNELKKYMFDKNSQLRKDLNQYLDRETSHYVDAQSMTTVLSDNSSFTHDNITKMLMNRYWQTEVAKTYSNFVLNEVSLNHDMISLGLHHIRDIYPEYFEYSDISTHPALVIIPYQVSFMSLFEFYRMNIPLFIPSLELLIEWNMKYRLLNERTWDNVFHRPSHSSRITRDRASNSSLFSDPNDEYSRETLKDWLKLADFYMWPFITTFSSFEELFEMLMTFDGSSVSKQMEVYNKQQEIEIKMKWNKILDRIVVRKQSHQMTGLPDDFNEALRRSYGYELNLKTCYDES